MLTKVMKWIAIAVSRESAVEGREPRTVDGFSVVQTSILSSLSSFKQQKPSALSGENGQRLPFVLLKSRVVTLHSQKVHLNVVPPFIGLAV
jgi:hypothetical protein